MTYVITAKEIFAFILLVGGSIIGFALWITIKIKERGR